MLSSDKNMVQLHLCSFFEDSEQKFHVIHRAQGKTSRVHDEICKLSPLHALKEDPSYTAYRWDNGEWLDVIPADLLTCSLAEFIHHEQRRPEQRVVFVFVRFHSHLHFKYTPLPCESEDELEEQKRAGHTRDGYWAQSVWSKMISRYAQEKDIALKGRILHDFTLELNQHMLRCPCSTCQKLGTDWSDRSITEFEVTYLVDTWLGLSNKRAKDSYILGFFEDVFDLNRVESQTYEFMGKSYCFY